MSYSPLKFFVKSCIRFAHIPLFVSDTRWGRKVTVHAEGVYFPSLVASEQPGILQKSGDRPPETTTIVSPCHENVEKKS